MRLAQGPSKELNRMRHITKALLAAGALSILAGLSATYDRLSGTSDLWLSGLSQLVVGLAIILIGVQGERNGRKKH